ncbi:endonuclease III [Candidatus Geothermarchaeota archaeon]|nr:MAG: endonuclease III [Candidatus Geothermarchaeota archaeon]
MVETEDLAREVYNRLKNIDILQGMRFTSLEAGKKGDLFEILIATILSQNTNDKNSIEAYKSLERRVGIEPYKIVETDLNLIIDAIKPAGLYNSKARTIINVARYIIQHLDGDLSNLKKLGFEEARKILLDIDGIGYKTADILLLHLNFPAFPVDTHIKRVSKRLGLVDADADYEDISMLWRKSLKHDEYLDAHIRLIAFGRKYCKARKPLCNICPLRDICKYVEENG